jgi:hypothetical protein
MLKAEMEEIELVLLLGHEKLYLKKLKMLVRNADGILFIRVLVKFLSKSIISMEIAIIIIEIIFGYCAQTVIV